jgi:hypothetical protein
MDLSNEEPQASPPQLLAALSGRLANLPVILAGPIVRHVEAGSVTVWLALRVAKQATLTIYDATGILTQFKSQASPTRQVGAALFVVAVTASTTDSTKQLKPGTLYTYNIQFDPIPGGTTPGDPTTSGDLFAPKFLTVSGSDAEALITYGTLGKPAFVLPPSDPADLKICHGSCREPHADGIDMLASLDDLLRQDSDQPFEVYALRRPHQLFLTGDQIYADEMSQILFSLVLDAGPVLLGASELLPLMNKDGTAGVTTRFGPENRQKKIQGSAGFSTGAGQSHLMSFAEYAVIYLFMWSDTLWPDPLPGYHEVFPRNTPTSDPTPETKTIPGPKGTTRTVNYWAFDIYQKQLAAVTSFRLSLPKVRRALANISTYMIFDDHDVTDDWYINRRFCEKVIGGVLESGQPSPGSPLGRRIVQNALAAYAFFQGWGNVIGGSSDPGDVIPALDAFESWRAKGYPAEGPEVSILGDLLGVPTGPLQAPASGEVIQLQVASSATRWHYAHKWVGHEVIVVDSRTRRGYEALGRRLKSPALIAEAGLSAQIDPDLSHEEKVTFVVVPGVLVGIPAPESFQEGNLSEHDAFDLDVEVWRFDQTSFESLLSSLTARGSRNRRIVVLSGDVHYAFSYGYQYWPNHPISDPSTAGSAVMALNVCSALKKQGADELTSTRTLHRTGFTSTDAFFSRGPLDLRTNTRLLWNLSPSEVGSGSIPVGSASNNQKALTAPTSRKVAVMQNLNRVASEVGALGANGPDPSLLSFSRKPDTVAVSTFKRSTNDGRTVPPPTPVNDRPAGFGDRAAAFLGLMFVNKTDYFDTLTPGSEIVGVNNLAIVRFERRTNSSTGASELFTIQDLYWRPGDPGPQYKAQKDGTLAAAQALTKLEVRLEFDPRPVF